MKKLVLTDIEKLELVEEPIPVPGEEEAVVRVGYAHYPGTTSDGKAALRDGP